MTERWFVAPDRRTWLVRPRPGVRRDEAPTHVTLEFASDGEIRVVSCERDEWEAPDADLLALLTRSVTSGASHSVGHPPSETTLPPT